MGRKGGFVGEMISVFFLSIVIFFVLYFFMPDVSVKFFGFSKDQAYEKPMPSADASIAENAASGVSKTAEEATDDINAFLQSEDGRETALALNNLARKAGQSVSSIMERDDVKSIFSAASSFIMDGAGTAYDFFSNGEGRRMIEGISE